MSDCPSRLVLAEFHADAGQAVPREKIEAHLQHCPGCRETMQRIEENALAYHGNFDRHAARLRLALAQESSVPQKSPHRKTPVTRFLFAAGAVAVAASLLFLILPATMDTKPDTEEIAYKGGFAVSIYAKRGENQFPVSNGMALREGDALRFSVQTAKAGYIYIFLLDSKGMLTRLYPFGDAPSAQPLRLPSPGEHLLEDSVVLDGSTGTEHLVAVFTTRRYPLEKIAPDVAKNWTENKRSSLHISEDKPSSTLETDFLHTAGKAEIHVTSILKKP